MSAEQKAKKEVRYDMIDIIIYTVYLNEIRKFSSKSLACQNSLVALWHTVYKLQMKCCSALTLYARFVNELRTFPEKGKMIK